MEVRERGRGGKGGWAGMDGGEREREGGEGGVGRDGWRESRMEEGIFFIHSAAP